MANVTHSTKDQPDALVDLTQKLNEMGASTDIITEVITRAYEIKRSTAATVMDQFNNKPATMLGFTDELHMLRCRMQGLGVAMLGLIQEYPDDGYVEGIHQMVLDLEQNARRLETTFGVLLGEQLNKNQA
jgi:hypothetical protein